MADTQGQLPITISDKPVTSDAPAWMLNRLDGSHHEALTTDVKDLVWDGDKQEFALLRDDVKPDKIAIYKDAEAQKKAFAKTVDSYNVEARKHGSLEMDIFAEHTWDEVLAVQQSLSEDRDVQTSKGFKGFWRKNVRRFGDNSESFKPWLKLLPTESHYLSVLCGGLTLVLGAARRMSEIRESIRSVIDGIPATLSRVKDYVKVFEDCPAVHKCSADLYVVILGTLDLIVREYHKHVAHRITSAMFKQTMSGKALQDKIDTIELSGDRLAAQANISFMERQKFMLEGEKDITKMMISSRRRQDLGFNTIAYQNNGISEVLKSQERKLESQDQKLQSLTNALNECMGLLTASPIHRIDPVNRIKYLEPETPTEGFLTPRSRSPSPNTALERENTRQQLKRLLGKLSIDDHTDVAAEDTFILLNLVHTLSLPSQDRAVALITSPLLQRWVTSTSSCALHINGHMSRNEHEERESPLSYVCAKMTDSILTRALQSRTTANGNIVAVRWFCGEHTNMAKNFDAHPTGMMNNLLAQFIKQLLDFTNPPALNLSLADSNLDLAALCTLFALLAEALTAGTALFCIIDGISFYEDTSRRSECIEVLSMLTGLARRNTDPTDGCLIKLLVTAPLRSRNAQDLFMKAEMLDMEEYIPPRGGFSALEWDLGIGRVIGG